LKLDFGRLREKGNFRRLPPPPQLEGGYWHHCYYFNLVKLAGGAIQESGMKVVMNIPKVIIPSLRLFSFRNCGLGGRLKKCIIWMEAWYEYIQISAD
jgi:hypothetical protein